MKQTPNEQNAHETPQTKNKPTTWGNSTVVFDINNPENNDKLTILAEAGF